MKDDDSTFRPSVQGSVSCQPPPSEGTVGAPRPATRRFFGEADLRRGGGVSVVVTGGQYVVGWGRVLCTRAVTVRVGQRFRLARPPIRDDLGQGRRRTCSTFSSICCWVALSPRNAAQVVDLRRDELVLPREEADGGASGDSALRPRRLWGRVESKSSRSCKLQRDRERQLF